MFHIICTMWTIFTTSLQPAGHPLTYGGHYCVKSTPDAITVGHMKTSHCVWNHRRVKFIMFHSRSILLVFFTILGLSLSCIPALPQPPPCVEMGDECGLFVGRCCGGKLLMKIWYIILYVTCLPLVNRCGFDIQTLIGGKKKK